MNSKTILLATDNGLVVKGLSMKLRSCGHAVLTAQNAGETVSAVRQHKPVDIPALLALLTQVLISRVVASVEGGNPV